MAASIKITAGLSADDSTTKFSRLVNPLQVTQTQAAQYGDGPKTVVVGSGAEEDLPVAVDIATLGWAVLQSLEPATSTNYVKYGPKSGAVMVPFGRLKAGERHVVRLEPGITIRWQGFGGNVPVDILILND